MDVQIRHDVPQTSGMRVRCGTTAQMMADAFTKVDGSSHQDHVLRGCLPKKRLKAKGRRTEHIISRRRYQQKADVTSVQQILPTWYLLYLSSVPTSSSTLSTVFSASQQQHELWYWLGGGLVVTIGTVRCVMTRNWKTHKKFKDAEVQTAHNQLRGPVLDSIFMKSHGGYCHPSQSCC